MVRVARVPQHAPPPPRSLPLTPEIHELGLQLAERYEFSIYDAMIVSAANLADCDRLWSEDGQDGMRIGKGLRLENLFR